MELPLRLKPVLQLCPELEPLYRWVLLFGRTTPRVLIGNMGLVRPDIGYVRWIVLVHLSSRDPAGGPCVRL